VIGRIEAGGVRLSLAPPSGGGGGGGGAVSSVFGRTGAVTAQSGDYLVSQITGAAPLASPTFSGVMTHPDGTSISASGWAGSPTFLNNVTISGNLSVAGNISQTSNTPTQWSGKEWTGTTVTVPSGMDFSLGVGSDATFHCQLASGASCMPSGGGAVSSVFGRTGAVVAQAGDYTAAQVGLGNVTNNAQTQAAIVPNTVPAAGQILVGNSGGTAYAPQSLSGDCTLTGAGAITCTKTGGTAFAASATVNTTNATNITSGNLPVTQLPSGVTWPSSGVVETVSAAQAAFSGIGSTANKLVQALNANAAPTSVTVSSAYVDSSICSNAGCSQNTSGTAANLSGTPALPNGATGTTQGAKDGSTKLATDAYADGEVPAAATQFLPFPGYNSASQSVFPTASNTAAVYSFVVPFAVTTSKVAYKTGSAADNSSNTYEVGIYNSNGTLVLSYQAAGSSFAAAASTWYRQSWSQGSTTLAPGKYYEAITTSCSSSCANFWGSASTTGAYYSNSAFAVTAGGTLPASITAPGSGYESFGANVLAIILE